MSAEVFEQAIAMPVFNPKKINLKKRAVGVEEYLDGEPLDFMEQKPPRHAKRRSVRQERVRNISMIVDNEDSSIEEAKEINLSLRSSTNSSSQASWEPSQLAAAHAPTALASNRSEDPTERAMFRAMRRRSDNSQPDSSIYVTSDNGSGSPLKERQGCECLRILVVDDNVFNLYTFEQLLEEFYSMKVDTAINGKEAVDKYTKSLECCPYRMIFMDLNMPVMNGIDATKKIFALRTDILEGRADQIIERSQRDKDEFLQ